MSSISAINGQLKRLTSEIGIITESLPVYTVEQVGVMAPALESLCRAQKLLVETQIAIFIEATESDLDMPTLPLFCEERTDDDEEETDEPAGEV